MPESKLAIPRLMKPTIHISLCTNNPDNGMDTGRVCGIHVGAALTLAWGEERSEPKYGISSDGKLLKLSRKEFPILGSRDWEGNWCWTGIWMTPEVAAEFLAYIHADDRWHNEAGWCDFSDLYESKSVTPEWLTRNWKELESI